MDEIYQYIVKDAFILVPVLVVLGKIIKDTPYIKNWCIPYVLLLIGELLSITIMGFTSKAIIQGILVTGVSVFSYESFKQLTKGGK